MRVRLIVAIGAGALVLAGCSWSGSTHSSTSDGSSSGYSATPSGPIAASALEQVQSRVAQFSQRPSSLGLTGSVGSVPAGKTVYYIQGQGPAGAASAASFKQAAAAVGWDGKTVLVASQTPQGFQQAFNTALQDTTTSAIVSASVDPSALSAQVTVARGRDIPVVILSSPIASAGDIISLGGPSSLAYAGTLEADYILANTKGNANVLLATAAAFPALDIMASGFKTEWEKVCPKCATPLVYEAPLASFGSNFPSLLTAYLQGHHGINYIDFGFNDEMIGVQSALNAAGLGSVKSITFNQGPETNSLLGGLLQAEIGFPLLENPWLAIDALIRHFNGKSTAPDEAFNGPTSPYSWYVTKSSLAQADLSPADNWPLDASYITQFKSLWGIR